jgi:tetratricopeptide (TPR) repeat protein
VSREQQDGERSRLSAVRARIDARLSRPRRPSDDQELDAYLDLTLVCTARGQLPKGVTIDALVPDGPARPLLEYRLGACGLDKETHLDAALAAEPRFLEAFLIAARYRLVAARGGSAGRAGPRPSWPEARDAFTKALAAFPDSPAIAMELANALRQRSVSGALALYERVIARVPDHHDAWLGKGMCQSYLGRHTDAVATFTHLIGMGRWLVGESHYWRAWNRHQLKELDAAWADVETAKQTLYNADLYTLAGVIAYDRQQLEVARPHLEKGLELQPRNCTAAWYLGLVHAAQERWPEAGDTFTTASSCYRLDADDGRRQLTEAEALEATEEGAEARASQIAAARAAIDESTRQEALSAYNAAYGFVRAQQIERARPLLAAARQHADVKVRADELIAYVDRP